MKKTEQNKTVRGQENTYKAVLGSSGGGLALMHAVMPSSRGLLEGVLAQSPGLFPVSMAESSKNTDSIFRRVTAFNASSRRIHPHRIVECAFDACAEHSTVLPRDSHRQEPASWQWMQQIWCLRRRFAVSTR